MKVGILQEGEVMPGVSYAQRYRDIIEEVALADKLGFSTWGTSEQHFSPPRFTVSAPEVLYAAVSQHTKRIKLRVMCSVLLKWNHPILVAERLATLNIVSNGRAEIGTARSNNLTTLGAFGVKPNETVEQWNDSMAVLAKIFASDQLEHDGPVWKIPQRTIVPSFDKDTHPPVSVAASSVKTHASAGEMQIGAMCFENYFGFDYLQECINAYRNAYPTGRNAMPNPNSYMGLYVATSFCGPTRAEAARIARDVALGYFKFILDLYVPLSKNPSYEYLERIQLLEANETNLDFLMTETPSVLIGSPADFIERLRKLEAMGIDEVLLRIDGVPHEEIMKSIHLIGTEVIPAVDREHKIAAE
ncbi:LLM class flavin-dependent oxidoreductase [Hyphomicrobium sp.]|uniref:LLM class flavin-dependent oxidoreductase n=1 Tax=Hyphomicrobium sp. TaxID=82 RepID=UPI001D24393C|nr:LLM class flavin-dependent oxidoreductase [Hyphomicrobium sp.]MBY0558688.1 LLM class flavin-dependent oxidoreductase [Hyphomicrobium sp.]